MYFDKCILVGEIFIYDNYLDNLLSNVIYLDEIKDK